MLHLIKMWLEAPSRRRTSVETSIEARAIGMRSRESTRFSDQPVAEQSYMRRFVLGWKKLGHEKRLQAYIVNYADTS